MEKLRKIIREEIKKVLTEYHYTADDMKKLSDDLVGFIGDESKKFNMGEFDVVNLIDHILSRTSKVHSKLKKR